MKKKSNGRKRETTAERTMRELTRLGDLNKGERIAYMIKAMNKEEFRDGTIPQIEKGFSRLGAHIVGCSPDVLRLIADFLEGKKPYTPGADWYDDKIKSAYWGAWEVRGGKWTDFNEFLDAYSAGESVDHLFCNESDIPSFSEFLAVFRQKNPQLERVSDRSLRRALQRLGCLTRPDKLGRPNGK